MSYRPDKQIKKNKTIHLNCIVLQLSYFKPYLNDGIYLPIVSVEELNRKENSVFLRSQPMKLMLVVIEAVETV